MSCVAIWSNRSRDLQRTWRVWFAGAVVAGFCCLAGVYAGAAPVTVGRLQGTVHGFLQLRAESGEVVASGDLIQWTHGGLVTSQTTFHFKDGSLDEETAVFSQRHSFQLISDHHLQKGPFFPHPMEMTIDCRSGQVTAHTWDKDGKEDVKTEHVDLPADLANGIVPEIVENSPANGSDTTVSMVVLTPKPRVVKLMVSSRGEEPFAVAGGSEKAVHYEIKIDLGGVAKVVAPVIGKQPPNIQVWIMGGQAPTLIREQGPLYAEGPLMTIELASPSWPNLDKPGEAKAGH